MTPDEESEQRARLRRQEAVRRAEDWVIEARALAARQLQDADAGAIAGLAMTLCLEHANAALVDALDDVAYAIQSS